MLAALDGERLSDAVLCGHGYGGVVISGVADRVPERLRALVYLDALVPADGDCAWARTNDAERERTVAAAGEG